MFEQLSNLFSAINLPSFTMPSFGFNSILDISLIAFCIYRLLIWIKETRAWTVLKGIIVVALIYMFSFLFSMFTTVWIIGSTFNVAMVAVLVIFQPELRKALERLGNNRSIPFITSIEEAKDGISVQVIDNIVLAATKMSHTKTGALIVIEQKVPLGDLETTGLAIDALVTSQLLLNIFENNTPLHDGAVLIRENRVSAATCILPLTTEKLSSELGTRHRAALGISETSDCYALVVSEESGSISIAREGKLYRNLSEANMRSILAENIKYKKRGKKKRKGNIVRPPVKNSSK